MFGGTASDGRINIKIHERRGSKAEGLREVVYPKYL
jgi:hypothetical protein